MKTILYLLIVVFVVSIFAGSINYGNDNNKTIVLKAVNEDITSEIIAESATIISNRLKTYSTEKFRIKQMPGNQKIQISFSEAWNIDTALLLATQKGRLSFEEVCTADELMKEDQLLFHQLVQKLQNSESKRSGVALGQFNSRDAQSIKDFINLSGLSNNYWFACDFAPGDSNKNLYALHYHNTGTTSLTNSSIEYSESATNTSGMSYIQIQFSEAAAPVWKMMTEKNLNGSIAIVLDGMVLGAPVVKSVIENGNCQITGNFTVNEVKYISALISPRDLPISLYPIK